MKEENEAMKTINRNGFDMVMANEEKINESINERK